MSESQSESQSEPESETAAQAVPEDSLLQQIDGRIAALEGAEKALKKRSTISFAERQSLTHRAEKAVAELRARREELEGQDAPAEGALPEPLRVALEGADRVLGQIDGAHPAALHQRGPAGRNLPNQQRRGTGGMSSQQRPPDRIGE